MQILIVVATPAEIAPVSVALRSVSDRDQRTRTFEYQGHDIDIVTTGVGMTATAAWCSRAMSRVHYDVALNLGLCGSFDRALTPGTVVSIRSECISELGAEDGGRFLSIHDLGLAGENEFPFTCGRIVNTAPPGSEALRNLPAVDGITVNTCHGSERSIAMAVDRFKPHVESMEGAAFMYASAIHEVAFAEVRAVSNIVERRNRAAWDIEGAIRNLGRTALDILNDL